MNCPSVLIIDDDPDVERAKFDMMQSHQIILDVCHPQDVVGRQLFDADVVVVDFKLDEGWKQRDSLKEIALQPLNGLAVISILQSHAMRAASENESPTAFVLRSAHLNDLLPDFTADSRLHVIAAQCNLDWVLTKNVSIEEQGRQLTKLATAIQGLPASWDFDDANRLNEQVREWLKLPDSNWGPLAWQDIEDCHPPMYEIVSRKHGLRLVRWLTQRILPYPCFLWTTARIANRLRVSLASMETALKNGLSELLQPVQYNGALNEFDGQVRWWRSGFESVLWELTEGRSFDTDHTRELLNQRCDGALTDGGMNQPVLCLDREFQIQDAPCEMEDAVRIHPDYWPVYADPAWARIIDVADEPRLASAVIAADRERLSQAIAEGS